jgi:PleD family two-component response regulator
VIRQPRVLLVDDDEGDRMIVRRAIGQAGLSYTFVECANAADALDRAHDCDCVLLANGHTNAATPLVAVAVKVVVHVNVHAEM